MGSSKYVDNAATIQVIGCVYNNPSLLDMKDKYIITDEDFNDEFHRIVFGSIYNLYELGVEKITLENISDFLSSRPKYEAIYKLNKGPEWITQIASSVNPVSFDYYYNRLKKMSLLRAYDKYGIDVSFIYDPDNILDVAKKQQQEDFLDNSSLETISNLIDDRIEEIKYRYINAVDGTSVQAGDGINELIDSLKEHPEVGSPLYGNFINTITRGARLRKFYLRSAATGVGKAIPNYTIIPTPNGDKKVEDINVGDYLFGQNGKPTKVLAKYPQKEKKNVWIITFSDGRKAECCGEHLWEYYYENNGEFKCRVEDIETIYNRSIKLKNNHNQECKFYIKLNEPVEYPKKDYFLHPYVMGTFLGDKNFKYNPKVKFILKDFLMGSVEQRYELLRGLMDTSNGDIDEKGRLSYITTSSMLRDDFITLCRSLGFIVNYSIDSESSEKYYKIYIQCREETKPNVFKSKEKVNKAIEYINLNKIEEYKEYLAIVNIEKTERLEDMTCFTVDNESHLFLMNDFIVTHNTRSMIADACYLSCDEFFHEEFGWIKNGIKEPLLFITTEQDKSEVQTMMLAFLSNVNEEHILNNTYSEDEEERVLKAAKILKESPLYIRELSDFSLLDVENEIKKAIRDYDIKYTIFDYIHTSMKILEEITHRSGGVKLREDNILFMLSNKLKDLCNQYGIFILSGTQLNGDFKDAKVPDQNLLRGAKSIADWIKFYN